MLEIGEQFEYISAVLFCVKAVRLDVYKRQGDENGVQRSAHTALMLALILGIVLTIAGIVFSPVSYTHLEDIHCISTILRDCDDIELGFTMYEEEENGWRCSFRSDGKWINVNEMCIRDSYSDDGGECRAFRAGTASSASRACR